jgi:hypothetical protein
VSSALKYYTSERFIADHLMKLAESLVDQVRKDWRKNRHLESFVFVWPSETITGDDGSKIDRWVLQHLPDSLSVAERAETLKRLVVRTKAYGIAVTERRPTDLRVLFETHHGARAWTVPLERHGDLLVPGKTQVSDNKECLGLLWSPHQGRG